LDGAMRAEDDDAAASATSGPTPRIEGVAGVVVHQNTTKLTCIKEPETSGR
jgi:hypothetical protein